MKNVAGLPISLGARRAKKKSHTVLCVAAVAVCQGTGSKPLAKMVSCADS